MTGNKCCEEKYEAEEGDKNDCGDEDADSTGWMGWADIRWAWWTLEEVILESRPK